MRPTRPAAGSGRPAGPFYGAQRMTLDPRLIGILDNISRGGAANNSKVAKQLVGLIGALIAAGNSGGSGSNLDGGNQETVDRLAENIVLTAQHQAAAIIERAEQLADRQLARQPGGEATLEGVYVSELAAAAAARLFTSGDGLETRRLALEIEGQSHKPVSQCSGWGKEPCAAQIQQALEEVIENAEAAA